MTKVIYIPSEIVNAAIDEHDNRKPVKGHSIYLMILLKRIKPRLMQILLQGLKLLKAIIHSSCNEYVANRNNYSAISGSYWINIAV